MRGKELVEQTLKGTASNRMPVPKGEIEIARGFIERMLTDLIHEAATGIWRDSDSVKPEACDNRRVRIEKKKVLETLGADLVNVDLSGVLEHTDVNEALEEIEEWAREDDLFVFAMVGGVFWPLCQRAGFEQYCGWLKNNASRLKEETLELQKQQVHLAKEALKRGADGFIIADDLAYQRGTFLSPRDLHRWIFPYLKDELQSIQEKGKPVFFHTCGNINSVIEEIVSMGFQGLQGLQPSSDMDIMEIKKKFGEKITLMGNFEPDYWGMLKLEDIKKEVENTLRLCKGGGRYIAGTSGGLSFSSDPWLIRKLYDWFKVA